MQISQRVCAIVITSSNELVLIKNSSNPAAPYWTAPGGNVQDKDGRMDLALNRELFQLTSSTINVIKPVLELEHILEEDVVVQQWFYLCYLADSKFTPRLNENGKPLVNAELIALKPDVLRRASIHPAKLKSFLMENCERLLAVPAIR